MACGDNGICLDGFINLCSVAYTRCITNLRQVFGDLISNQRRIIDLIAPVVEGVDGNIAVCGRVYLNPNTCTYTGTASADAIPVGFHAFGGRVVFDGKTMCGSVNGSVNCGEKLDENLSRTSSGGVFVALENGGAGDCTKLMAIPSGNNGGGDGASIPDSNSSCRDGAYLTPDGSGGAKWITPAFISSIYDKTPYNIEIDTTFDGKEIPGVEVEIPLSGLYLITRKLDGAGISPEVVVWVRMEINGNKGWKWYVENSGNGAGWNDTVSLFARFQQGDILTINCGILDPTGQGGFTTSLDGAELQAYYAGC